MVFGRNFCEKREIWVYEPHFGDVRSDARPWLMARWKKMVDFLFALIELFRLVYRLPWAYSAETARTHVSGLDFLKRSSQRVWTATRWYLYLRPVGRHEAPKARESRRRRCKVWRGVSPSPGSMEAAVPPPQNFFAWNGAFWCILHAVLGLMCLSTRT